MAESRRVALLARPGEACERLRAALREAGGDIVLEADPSTIDPQALRAAAVETVLVALDPAVEDALEKFDDVLSDRAIEVIFDEADLAARREGWDAARWVRHLSAKLHRHDDVLPPGREPDGDAPEGEIPAVEVSIDDVESLDAMDVSDAALELAAADEPFAELSEPEPVDVESIELGSIETDGIQLGGIELGDIDLGGVDLDSVALSLADIPAAADLESPAVEATTSFEASTAEAPAPYTGISFTDDLDALDFDGGEIALSADVPAPTFHQDTQDFDALMRDLGGDAMHAASDDAVMLEMPPVREFAPAEALPNLGFDIAALDAPTAKEVELAMPDFGSLSLEAVTDVPAGATATLKATDAPVAAKFKHDISELERRISSLELVDSDAPVAKPAPAPAPAPAPVAAAPAAPVVDFSLDLGALDMAPLEMETPAPVASAVAATDARGAVLIVAGIGGPDAVRQILTALPQGFPRAVLISQRLDGGRYDRLVQQMARAAALPVHLAEATVAIAPGNVYILPPDIGVASTDCLRFAAGASQLEALAADDSAVLLLSGADPTLVDPALAHAAGGALVAGQAPDGCYDAAAPVALLARGGTAGAPHELVQSLLQRWPARD
jgi:chemotaxis response regulator CheB